MVEPDDEPDMERIIEHLAEALSLLGLDAERDSELQGTPERIARLWKERLWGLDTSHAPLVRELSTPGDAEDMVVTRDLPFITMCAHHFTPITGKADIAYIPGEKLVGVGTPARVLEYYSRRPQIQERLGEQIAGYLVKAVNPRGVMVHLTGRQSCMEMRGLGRRGFVETTATRGWFSDAEWRAEFFGRLQHRGPI